ncbi:uncharacterized protein TM35_000281920 [Trypanosoma theileri]|uniref:Uncharacterized protein n=1 Tax=Trypanosoma theileri TaxID=67003 RepID=A0A1X0NP37_9TRYP|nr:uncharacterized protein TM35_000281920 [Trypanosoma theileri]ORC86476.1 hypothetical protein TM35_000281920 [Trypanosoma theileri]
MFPPLCGNIFLLCRRRVNHSGRIPSPAPTTTLHILKGFFASKRGFFLSSRFLLRNKITWRFLSPLFLQFEVFGTREATATTTTTSQIMANPARIHKHCPEEHHGGFCW